LLAYSADSVEATVEADAYSDRSVDVEAEVTAYSADSVEATVEFD
jgi:hypothetical protein